MNEWCNCIVVAGERGILSTEDFGGIIKRVVEIQISSELKRINEKVLEVVKKTTEKNYGFAGQEYIQNIIPLIGSGELKSLRKKVVEQIGLMAGDTGYYYTDVVSIVLLADYLASIHVFHQEEDIAWAEMQKMFKVIYQQYDQFDSDTEAEYKYNALMNWIESNQHTFDGSVNNMVNGYFIDADGNRDRKEPGWGSNRIKFDKAEGVIILSSALKDFEKNKHWGYKRLLTDLRKIGVVAERERLFVDMKQQRVVQIKLNH